MTGPRITNAKYGAIKAFREYLNEQFADSPKWGHNKFHQETRTYGDYLYAQDREKFLFEMDRAMEGHADFPGWDYQKWLKHDGQAQPAKFPSAHQVKTVLKYVDVGAYCVSYDNRWGDERFPWSVRGPADSEGVRDAIDEFPQYRQAIQFAKAENKKYMARAELTEEKTHG